MEANYGIRTTIPTGNLQNNLYLQDCFVHTLFTVHGNGKRFGRTTQIKRTVKFSFGIYCKRVNKYAVLSIVKNTEKSIGIENQAFPKPPNDGYGSSFWVSTGDKHLFVPHSEGEIYAEDSQSVGAFQTPEGSSKQEYGTSRAVVFLLE